MEQIERLSLLSSEFGFPLDTGQLESLGRYRDWLETEAFAAGGIGPNEVPHLMERHIADALTWLQPLDRAPSTMLDIGSGVGLPGIPLAIALPETAVTLLDRSGRRCGLLRRAIRMLDLQNATVDERDVAEAITQVEVVVSRASLPPAQLRPHLERLAGRLAIVGGSSAGPREVPGYSTAKIESRYLDSPRWVLIMRQS
ncbi:MAG: class I SAM-dependent methyltransferase [Acidimicrobiia bacterium]|nr:class I SAM-dependent methyltransferase [Acidimicrobiia bacterium]